MISIVDCGMGNLGSVRNMFNYIDVPSEVVSSVAAIEQAQKLILPGVGSWDHGLANLTRSGLREVLDHKVLTQKVPLLGICLGMQVLAESSQEGDLPGLGWIPGKVVRFGDDVLEQGLKIPHMGWNRVFSRRTNVLTDSLPDDPRFYFVHSFHFCCSDPSDVLMTSKHGSEFVCAVQRDNIYGVQFHPEKSHKFGLALMKSFSEL
ncbi:imidazole glycerol phosphate synthase subunit HisH [Motiliproteus sediminis]|uniref:imidazole glycerol phosphate synthase subunit HisH n=1 Tax=Motiliproteus sediminis TaxID=1468178 RepID=UPI001AEFFE95|nr:imidazole glycerol phosphate synthase subunit HisH [Motiliproteus sediminis]